MNKNWSTSGGLARRMLCLGALIQIGCGRNQAPDPVVETTLSKMDIVDNLSLTGTLESEESVDLKSQVSGIILKICKQEGDDLNPGDTILVIDPLQLRIKLERDKLAMQKSRIELDQAELDLKEAESLKSSGGISARQVTLLKWKVDLAKIELSQVRSESEETKLELGYSVVTSPIRGTLVALNVKKGEVIVAGTASVGGGTLLGTAADMKHLRVSLGVSELDYPNIHIGLAAYISSEADPARKYRGHISYISPTAREMEEKGIRFFETRIILDSLGEKLVPGIGVTAQVPLLALKDVLGIRSEFLQMDPNDNSFRFVWKLENGNAKRTPVRTGGTNYILTEIVSGLEAGDRVVMGPTVSAQANGGVQRAAAK